MSPEKTRAKHSSDQAENKQGSFEIGLPIRLGIAAVLVIISALFKMPVLLQVILLVASAVAAGYDIFLAAVDDVADRNYFSTSLVIVFTAVLSFVIGFGREAAVMIIMYQLSKILIRFTKKQALSSAENLVSFQDDDIKQRVQELMSDEKSGATAFQKSIEESATFVLRFVLVFSLLYALFAPLLTGIGFRVSIHRAMMMLLISSPMSVAVSFPVVGLTALCFNIRNGVLFSSAEDMETANTLNVAIFDKAGIFSDDVPHLIGLQSDILDKKNFLHFLAHAVYYSDQPFAKAISDYYDQEYRLELIGNFSEIPGSGVTLEIGNAPVILATKSYFDSQGIPVPDRKPPEGIAYYMTIAGRYVGRIVISAEIDQDAVGFADEMVNAGISRNILLTEDSNEQSQSVAESLHFSEVIGECDMDKKLRLISDITQNGQNKTAFVYANGIEGHSAATMDIRVSRKGKYADVLVLPESYLNLPLALRTCARTTEIIQENAIIVFVVKAILIFLSIIGYSNLWFVVFIDTVAALGSMLNAIRVTTPSLIAKKHE